MMIARQGIRNPVAVAGHQPSSLLSGSHPNVEKIAGANPACFANTRDREVPYGMKGGEH